MTKYLIVLAPAGKNWSGYVPDVLGCAAAADTLQQTSFMLQEALQKHLDWMHQDGDSIPEPCAETDTMTVALSGQPPRRYLVILQPTPLGNWSVTPADVSDLVLEFSTRAEALRLLQTALQSHLEMLAAEGKALPEPASEAATVSVRLADVLIAA